MNGSDSAMLLLMILLALVFCVLPVLAVANSGLVFPLILAVVLSILVSVAVGFLFLAYGGSKR